MFMSRFDRLILVTFILVAMATLASGFGTCSVKNDRGSRIYVFFLVLFYRKIKEASIGTGHVDAPMLLSKGRGHQNNIT